MKTRTINKKSVTKQPNKKVLNATPTTIDSILFKSKLEANTYKELKKQKIHAEYEPIKFVLLDKFEFQGSKLRQMTYTPDFVGTDFIIECKGMETDAFRLKWKLFKWYMQTKGIERVYDLYLIKNLDELAEAINKIKYNRLKLVN